MWRIRSVMPFMYHLVIRNFVIFNGPVFILVVVIIAAIVVVGTVTVLGWRSLWRVCMVIRFAEIPWLLFDVMNLRTKHLRLDV